MSSWKDFVIGWSVGLITVALIVGDFWLGFAPVALNAAQVPCEKDLANAALHREIDGTAGVQLPIRATEDNLLARARADRTAGAVCQSLPGLGETQLERGMYQCRLSAEGFPTQRYGK